MKHLIRLVAFMLATFLGCGALSAQEGPRYALVIGNSDYGELGQLKNPVNDAADMAAALRRLGFSTELLQNAELPQMEEAVVRFSDKLSRDTHSTGLFYYAGHGVQTQKGENYLIPVHASIPSETFLKTKALLSQAVLDSMQVAGNTLNLVFLDACRNNPFSWARSTTRGLAVVGYQPPGSIIVYATSSGSVAQDGTGRNGVFTGELLKNVETPGIDLDTILNRTAQGVMKATGNQQNPAVYKQYFKTAFLKGSGSQPKPSPVPSNAEPDFGSIVVTPGSATLTFTTAGTLNLKGKTLDVPAGGTLPVNNLAPGDYTATVTYADGKTETRTIHVESGSTVNVAFSYRPAPLKPVVPDGFVWVEGGAFTMGSPPSEAGRGSDEVQHQASVSGFAMAKYETTVSEFRAFAQATGYKTSAEINRPLNWRNPGIAQGDNEPAICVSWYDAVAYCNWRSAKEGKRPSYSYLGKGTDSRNWPSRWNTEIHNNIECDWTADGYRLPTEAEWEYAARASGSGPQTVTWAGSLSVGEVGWYGVNSVGRTHPVGQKKANGIGLYDMSGNVWEWCWDWYGDYSTGAQTSPAGPSSGSGRVMRGGSWLNDAWYLRVAYRGDDNPWYANAFYGVRPCVSSVR
jgi:formylglycine-generating enzyme required for sulfatase activity